MAETPVDPLDQRLDALHAAGAARHEPARFQIAAALARRRGAQPGPVRQRLDRRLALLLDDLQQRLDAAAAPAPPPAGARPGPLASLCAELTAPAADAPRHDLPAATAQAALPLPALRAVQQFGAGWARLRVQAQLRRASSQPQGQAGPLNSRRLMLQALQQLQRLSPAYLQRFMAQAETLRWLEDLGNAAEPAEAAAAPAARPAASAAARPPARAPTKPAAAPPRRRRPLRPIQE